jgi:hypothetical protein
MLGSERVDLLQTHWMLVPIEYMFKTGPGYQDGKIRDCVGMRVVSAVAYHTGKCCMIGGICGID